MLDKINTGDILFIDIETVPQFASFKELPEIFRALWDKKSSYFRDSEQTAEDVYRQAGIYAEFGKIVCISAGFVHKRQDAKVFRVKSFYDNNESQLLENFNQLLQSFFRKNKNARLCAHNGKEFDFPYISRRSIVNGIKLPKVLNVAGQKPWEVPFLDTMELWKFGDYKNYTSLLLLSAIMGIPTPKDDIDGSQVADVYYKENDIPRIVRYCEKDVFTVAQIFSRYKGESLIEEMLRVE